MLRLLVTCLALQALGRVLWGVVLVFVFLFAFVLSALRAPDHTTASTTTHLKTTLAKPFPGQ